MFLRRKGYEAEEAKDGAQALDLLNNFQFDLVISDIRLPRVDASELQTIFDPFSSAAKQEEYTSHFGLGLFVAREIVEAHTGKISVTSTAEDGTRFVVRLPRDITTA